jgi:hypothetical protein
VCYTCTMFFTISIQHLDQFESNLVNIKKIKHVFKPHNMCFNGVKALFKHHCSSLFHYFLTNLMLPHRPISNQIIFRKHWWFLLAWLDPWERSIVIRIKVNKTIKINACGHYQMFELKAIVELNHLVFTMWFV